MADDIIKQFIEETKGRAAVYEYLYTAYKSPVSENFIGLTKKYIDFFVQLTDDADNEDLRIGTEYLKIYVEKEEMCDKAELLDKLNIQWTGIFLTGANSAPYSESLARSGVRAEKEEPWEKVVAYYKIRGFKLPADFHESEDHIAAELLFMYEMCRLVIKLVEKKMHNNIPAAIKEQAVFLQDFMMQWIPEFCDITAKFCENTYSELPLYLGLVYITKGFLAYDNELLTNLVSAIDTI